MTTENAAAVALADAYATYAEGAEALTPILPAGVSLGRSAMIPALMGLNVTGQAAAVIQTAVSAFWTAVAGGLSVSFAGATVITPPTGTTGLVTALVPVFSTNVAVNASLEDATQAMANALHVAAVVGGTVTTPGTPPIITPMT